MNELTALNVSTVPQNFKRTFFFNFLTFFKMKNIIIFILSLCLLSTESKAQCYLKYTDASGMPMSDSDLQTLKDSACALKNIFPVEVKDSFAVVDFGFYSHNQNMVGGYPEFMNLMIKRLATDPKTKYYLLFGRESNSDYPNTKIWVKVVLPSWGRFKCMSEMQRTLVGVRCESKTDSIFSAEPNNRVFKPEIGTISSLKKQVAKIVDCCYANKGGEGCSEDIMTKNEILAYLLKRNFSAIPCKIIPNPTNTTNNPLGTFKVSVIDNADLTVFNPNYPNETVTFKHTVELVMGMKKEAGEEGTAYITKNENLADFSFEKVEKDFDGSNNKNDIWWHIWDNPIQGEDDLFLILRKDLQGKTPTLKNTEERGGDPCNPDWEKCPCYNFETQGTKSGIFFIFGTGDHQTWDTNPDDGWCGKETTFKPGLINNIDFLGKELCSKSHTNYTVNKCFDWSEFNQWDNGVHDRAKAAEQLVTYIRKNLPQKELNDQSIPITLIGYSHGGNVAIQAAPKIYEQLGKKVNLITISTPISNFPKSSKYLVKQGSGYGNDKFTERELKNKRYIENLNNPLIANAINLHYHFWIQNDKVVQGSYLLEGSHLISYSNKSWNIEIVDNGCVVSYPPFSWLGDTHGAIRCGEGDSGPGCFVPQITQMLKDKKLTIQN